MPTTAIRQALAAAIATLEAGGDDAATQVTAQLRSLVDEVAGLEVQTRAVAAANAHMAELYVALEEAKEQSEAREREVRRLERAHAESAALLASIVDTLPDALVVLDADARVLVWNQGATRLLGGARDAHLEGDFLSTHVATPDHPRVREAFSQGSSDPLEVQLRLDTGALLPVSMRVANDATATDGARRFVSITIRDLATLRQAEADSRQAQKLESVGRLAAGVAHEINTPMQFIGDSVTFAQDGWGGLAGLFERFRTTLREVASPEMLATLDEDELETDLEYLTTEAPRAFARALEGVERVAAIVRAMKEFAHPEGAERAAADLNRALSTTLLVATSELKETAEVTTDFAELPAVACHVGEMNQVFLNLLVNAAHAIQDSGKFEDGGRGTIGVVTRFEDDHVRISITDNGCGIPEAIRDRIYDPFFSTKEVGRGTGQGLAIARSVIAKHGGSISIESLVGQGTTFNICLPVG